MKIPKPLSQEMAELSAVPRKADIPSLRQSPTIFIKLKECRAIQDGSTSNPFDLYSEGAQLDSRMECRLSLSFQVDSGLS